ncbi:unnamed protein product [Clavelina lepadiformis]|uniref:Galectin n=1 Tax=Clavelina lepadiformis TaxID=159417 RepID=A0ABP0GRI7_CLALP
MTQPALRNVTLPLTTHINGMYPGRIITVNGVVRPNANRFSINLQTGFADNSDIALHFNPRFNEGNIVVRNSRLNGQWQGEERETPKFQFRHGQAFEVSILCNENKYKISVNGKHFVGFKHRMPFYAVSHLKIQGGIQVSNVAFLTENQFPPIMSSLRSPSPGSTVGIPFRNIRDHSVHIIGKMKPQANRFAINFLNDEGKIVFHLNPRFEERVIVRNANLGGWGPEERQLNDEFPMAKNSPFVFDIAVNKQGYHVKLNGVPQFLFNHRFRPINRVKCLQVTDGAFIYEILFY